MRVLVDTNILVRAVDGSHVDQHVANECVKGLLDQGHVLHVVPQVLFEWWVVATRPKSVNGLGMDVPAALSVLASYETTFRLLKDQMAVYAEWRRLISRHRVSGKAAHDARLVAAMAVHGIDHILTFNVQDFTRYSHVTVIAPADVT